MSIWMAIFTLFIWTNKIQYSDLAKISGAVDFQFLLTLIGAIVIIFIVGLFIDKIIHKKPFDMASIEPYLDEIKTLVISYIAILVNCLVFNVMFQSTALELGKLLK